MAAPIALATWVVFGLGLLVFLLICVLTGYATWRYRVKGVAEAEPLQLAGNGRSEWGWVVMAASLLVLLFALAWWTMNRADPLAGQSGQPDLVVTARQWFWQANYPKDRHPAGAGVVNAVSEIHIPAARRLLVELRSADVIHDFWVPQLARKMDVIPGQVNRVWLEAAAPGRYQGACSEFCGSQHAWMRFVVIAQPEAEFQAWLKAQAKPVQFAGSQSAALGLAYFATKGCGVCHEARGLGGRGVVGPDLTHFASRSTLAGGVRLNTPQNVRAWLRDPQAIKPGVRMPNFQLSDTDLTNLTAFLGALP